MESIIEKPRCEHEQIERRQINKWETRIERVCVTVYIYVVLLWQKYECPYYVTLLLDHPLDVSASFLCTPPFFLSSHFT